VAAGRPPSALRRVFDSDLWWSLRRSPVTVAAAVVALMIIGGALLAPWIAPHDPFDPASLSLLEASNPPAWLEGGSWTFPLGTDNQGSDVLSAILYGSRLSLFVGSSAVLVALLLGVTLDETRCSTEFAYAKRDLPLEGRPIAAGHVAGLKVRWEGIVRGRPVLELRQVWVMGPHIVPSWPIEHGWLVEIDGEPKVQTRLTILPHQPDLSKLTVEDLHGLGMIITALPAVNAIPAVCAAAPGIRTYADLPLVTGRGRLVLD